MTCANNVGWSFIDAASDFSVLAGVLAGFLIASAAILFASGSRYVPFTVALLASGVPGLVVSSYIFNAIKGSAAGDHDNCHQVWSQGLIATALLVVGGAVLVCGLGWVLVTYSEDLEGALSKQLSREGRSGFDQDAIENSQAFKDIVLNRRKVLVGLGGWMAVGIITASAVILVRTNTVYVKSCQLAWPWMTKHLICALTATGLYVILRSIYTVSRRTKNALDGFRGATPTRRTLYEFALLAMVMFSVLIAPWMAAYKGTAVFVLTLLIGTLSYVGGRLFYWHHRCRRERPKENPNSGKADNALNGGDPPAGDTTQQGPATGEVNPAAADTGDQSNANGGEDTVEALLARTLFQIGKLPETTFNVIFHAVLGVLFVGVTMGEPMADIVRIPLTFFLGGIYPAVLLIGLSRSVAAHEKMYAIPRQFAKSILQWWP